MATRNPADTSQPNFKCVDWYEPWYGKTSQSGIPAKGQLNSDEIYGQDTWNGTAVVSVDPIQVTYPT